MMEEAVYSRANHANVLTMQNNEGDVSPRKNAVNSFGKTQGKNLSQEGQFTNEHFGTFNKKRHEQPQMKEIDEAEVDRLKYATVKP